MAKRGATPANGAAIPLYKAKNPYNERQVHLLDLNLFIWSPHFFPNGLFSTIKGASEQRLLARFWFRHSLNSNLKRSRRKIPCKLPFCTNKVILTLTVSKGWPVKTTQTPPTPPAIKLVTGLVRLFSPIF